MGHLLRRSGGAAEAACSSLRAARPASRTRACFVGSSSSQGPKINYSEACHVGAGGGTELSQAAESRNKHRYSTHTCEVAGGAPAASPRNFPDLPVELGLSAGRVSAVLVCIYHTQ